MTEKLKKEELEEKIDRFLEDKNISNPLLRECVSTFIKGHNREYGQIISTEDVIKRLYENVDEITFLGRIKDAYGEYIKKDKNFKDKNAILIYEFESATNKETYIRDDMSEEIKERETKKYENKALEIKSVVIHELTHAAYTKTNKKGDIEHVFTLITDGENFFDEDDRRMQLGNSNFVEGIVNYIARETEGKIDEDGLSYRYQTKIAYLLAHKIGEARFINAVWNSDEEAFKKAYMETIKKPEREAEISFEALNEDMNKIKLIEKEDKDMLSYFDQCMKYADHIENLINGNEYLPIGTQKTAFEDVFDIDSIFFSSVDKTMDYIKEKYKQTKEMIKNMVQTMKNKDTEER